VQRVEVIAPAPAFSIELANFNTYYVGTTCVLVHDNSPVYDLDLTATMPEKP
jgi:hypothetical protein